MTSFKGDSSDTSAPSGSRRIARRDLLTALPFAAALSAAFAQPALEKTVENHMQHVHDPCIIKDKAYYYVFSTGHGIPIRRSRDLIHWERAGRVFAEDAPKWTREEIPGSVFPWAPDIAFFNGKYHLYYSISTFGKNRSLIGLATNTTLDAKSAAYEWKDEGKVWESHPSDDYNAIDSNVLFIGKDRLVMTIGSFWTGIKMVEMDAKSGKARPNATARPLARRPEPPDAIEAPFLIRRAGVYYLFVSFDLCCRGIRSTYNIRVGRAKAAEGPYTDRSGKSLLEGGGTVVLASQARMIGPGHCAVLRERGRDLLVYHFYDADSNGVPTLQIRPFFWDKDGWPVVAPPLGDTVRRKSRGPEAALPTPP